MRMNCAVGRFAEYRLSVDEYRSTIEDRPGSQRGISPGHRSSVHRWIPDNMEEVIRGSGRILEPGTRLGKQAVRAQRRHER